ncbi:MAG: M90 family metallopeptidase [Saprospiraceae bacterium]
MPSSTLLALTFFLLLVAIGLWRLFSTKKPLTTPFPPAWRNLLETNVPFYHALEPAEKTRFETSIQEFLSAVRITGVQTELDDTDRLLVASSAVIPLFGFPGWRYRNVTEVLLYEGSFNREYETREGQERNIMGLVGGHTVSTMILSKPALHEGFKDRHSPQNVGIHEFVHLLDRADGATDGVPESLIQQPFVIPWIKMMQQKITQIQSGDSDINPYGSTNEAEFLSVVSEYFFKQPQLLAENHPELFALLEKIYRQEG